MVKLHWRFDPSGSPYHMKFLNLNRYSKIRIGHNRGHLDLIHHSMLQPLLGCDVKCSQVISWPSKRNNLRPCSSKSEYFERVHYELVY